MKARILKKLLNDTKYIVGNYNKYIAIGSPLCHDLINVEKDTLKISYALDTFREGRKSVYDRSNEELLFIWDKLQSLIDSGEIHEIIEENDIIENPKPVFTIRDGKLTETMTDEYGWPNTTKEGWVMYDNTYFKTPEEALNYGIREYELGIESMKDRRSELSDKISKLSDDIESRIDILTTLKQQLLNYINNVKAWPQTKEKDTRSNP